MHAGKKADAHRGKGRRTPSSKYPLAGRERTVIKVFLSVICLPSGICPCVIFVQSKPGWAPKARWISPLPWEDKGVRLPAFGKKEKRAGKAYWHHST